MKVFILSILFKKRDKLYSIIKLTKKGGDMTKLEKIQFKLKILRQYREYLVSLKSIQESQNEIKKGK